MFIVLVVLAVMSGCSDDEHELVLSTNNWLGYMPLYLARDAGYYDDIPLHLVQLPSNTETMRSFRNGQVMAAGLTLDEALLLSESGVPVCIPLIMDYSNGADALVARAGIGSLEQLKGKRIGVENTAVGAHMLTRALDKAGLTLRDVTVVPLEVHEHLKSFRHGDIDVLVTFDPVRSLLLKEGARELFSSADIPGEVTDVLVVNRNYLEQHPATISVLVEGWERVVDRLNNKPGDVLIGEIAKYSGLPPETVRDTLHLINFPDHASNREILHNRRASFRDVARQMNETMLEQKVIGSRVDVDRLICPTELLAVYR